MPFNLQHNSWLRRCLYFYISIAETRRNRLRDRGAAKQKSTTGLLLRSIRLCQTCADTPQE